MPFDWQTISMFLVLLTLFMLEHIWNFFEFKTLLVKRVFANYALGIVNVLLGNVFLVTVFAWVTNVSLLGDLVVLPDWGVWLLMFLVFDFYFYWWHRFVHVLPLAWRFHKVHHTDQEMNVSTTFRFHIVEVFVSKLPQILIVGLFPFSLSQITLYQFCFIVITMFQHSNWRLPARFDQVLSWFIVSPNYHRIHHSDELSESNSNFANILTVWDRLFSSYTQPKGRVANVILGVKGYKKRLTFWELLKLPFQKNK